MKTYFLYREGTRRTDVLDAVDMPEAIAAAYETLTTTGQAHHAEVFKVAYDPEALDDPTILAIRSVAATNDANQTRMDF